MKTNGYTSFRLKLSIVTILLAIFSIFPASAWNVDYRPDTVSGSSGGYTEIEHYRQTLAPERIEAYEQALAEYLAHPEESLPVIKNLRLQERYRAVKEMPENDAAELLDKYYAYWSLSEDAGKKSETWLELDCLYQAFMLAYWTSPRNYIKAFEAALVLEQKLAGVTEQQYPDRRTAYYRISEGYYLFKDFDKSIELALKAITDNPPRSFTDRANLEGRKLLAMCYGIIGKFDLSDQYIYSTWESPDIVLDRPVYDATALSHHACNDMDRKRYRKAIALDREVLPFLSTTGDYGHVAGMYACQCYSYFGLGQPHMVGQIVDSILWYAERDWYNQNKRLKQAYSHLSRYNGEIGNIPKMQEYQDSLIAIYLREEAASASQYILQAEQNVARNRIESGQVRQRLYRNYLMALLPAMTVLCILLGIILHLYRRKQAAFAALVKKSEQWAESACFASAARSKEETLNIPDLEDLNIADKLRAYMLDQKPYTDPNLTLDTLSAQMDIPRNKLSRAVNRTHGNNFKQFLNEYRVREVMLSMKNPACADASLQELMERAGFNSRNSFYEAFKKATGLTPAQYRKSIKPQS